MCAVYPMRQLVSVTHGLSDTLSLIILGIYVLYGFGMGVGLYWQLSILPMLYIYRPCYPQQYLYNLHTQYTSVTWIQGYTVLQGTTRTTRIEILITNTINKVTNNGV